jgi:tetratricopeptide (TPR) repeat protein
MTSKLISRLTGDHLKLAETYEREGNKRKAAEEYAKAGDFRRAAGLAAAIQDESRLIRYSLQGALGRLPGRVDEMNAVQAGDLLAASGHFETAIPLFELAEDYRRAATAALKLKDAARAARYYEKSRMWPEAATHYEQAGLFEEALRALEAESKFLSRNRAEASPRQQDVDLKRAELLLQLGRSSAAVSLLLQLSPSVRRAELLERTGRSTEAIEAYLGAGESDKALALARKSPDQVRRIAQIHLRSGRPAQAGQIFASLGMVREAAEAYEAAQDWWQAAYRWETVKEPARAGEAYRQGGKLRDAARCFAAAGQPLLAAEICIRSGDLRGAAAYHAESGDLLGAVALYLQAGDGRQALATLRQLPAQEPEFLKGVLLMAPKLVADGAADEALRLLGQVPAPDPRRPGDDGGHLDRLYWEGRAFEALGQPGPARERYERVVAAAAAHRDAAERLGRLAPPRPAAATTVLATPDGLAIGQRLANRYDIVSELGKGGMGRVYKARDLDLGEMVAIKTLLTAAEGNAGADEERLLREVQICRRVSHPNVVRVFDLGHFDGGIFITMEMLEGQTLDELISPFESLPLSRIRFFLSEIAAGLQEAHALGIVHRDLKPSNVMVMARRLKILDFGIAHMRGFDTRLTKTGLAFGSPMYMSPEQLKGEPLDGRSDLYALGILAYAMIAGREPFLDENPAILALRHMQDPPPDVLQFRPDLPAPWVELLCRLLAKKPEDRYASTQELIETLAALPE